MIPVPENSTSTEAVIKSRANRTSENTEKAERPCNTSDGMFIRELPSRRMPRDVGTSMRGNCVRNSVAAKCKGSSGLVRMPAKCTDGITVKLPKAIACPVKTRNRPLYSL